LKHHKLNTRSHRTETRDTQRTNMLSGE
jgi:hypothetical protein